MTVMKENKNISISHEIYESLQELFDYHKLTWDEALEILTFKRKELSELLTQISDVEKATAYTIANKHDLWITNLKKNFHVISESKNLKDLPEIKTPALCLGNGPSFHEEIDNIKSFKGTVLCCERNLVKCLKNGIVPDYFVSLDGDPIMKTFIDDSIIDEYADNITGIFSVTCSNEVVSRWGGKKVFFTPYVDDPNLVKTMTRMIHLLTDKSILQVGGNCGSTLWFISYSLHAKPIYLLGIDFAYKHDTPYEETQLWKYAKDDDDPSRWFMEYTNKYGVKLLTDIMFHNNFKASLESWITHTDNTTYQCGKYSIVDCIEYFNPKNFKENVC